MVSSAGNISHANLEAELKAATAWLADLGINVSPTRFGRYLRALQELETARVSGYSVVNRAHELQAFDALFESNELVTIHKGLAGRSLDNYLLPRLRAVSSGPESYMDEGPSRSNKARNIAFELAVLERLHTGGMRPATNVPLVDLAVRVNDRTVMIECKRPQASTGAERVILRARDQLKTRYSRFARLDPVGIIAIDITKLFNPQLSVLLNKSRDEIASIFVERADSFFVEQAAAWDRVREERSVGVFLRQSILTWDEDSRVLSWVHWNGIKSLFRRGDSFVNAIKKTLDAATLSEGSPWIR